MYFDFPCSYNRTELQSKVNCTQCSSVIKVNGLLTHSRKTCTIRHICFLILLLCIAKDEQRNWKTHHTCLIKRFLKLLCAIYLFQALIKIWWAHLEGNSFHHKNKQDELLFGDTHVFSFTMERACLVQATQLIHTQVVKIRESCLKDIDYQLLVID